MGVELVNDDQQTKKNKRKENMNKSRSSSNKGDSKKY